MCENVSVEMGYCRCIQWRRDRKEEMQGGVMMAVKNNMTVDNAKPGEGIAEAINIKQAQWGQGKRGIKVGYDKTRAWNEADFHETLTAINRHLWKVVETDYNIGGEL